MRMKRRTGPQSRKYGQLQKRRNTVGASHPSRWCQEEKSRRKKNRRAGTRIEKKRTGNANTSQKGGAWGRPHGIALEQIRERPTSPKGRKWARKEGKKWGSPPETSPFNKRARKVARNCRRGERSTSRISPNPRGPRSRLDITEFKQRPRPEPKEKIREETLRTRSREKV